MKMLPLLAIPVALALGFANGAASIEKSPVTMTTAIADKYCGPTQYVKQCSFRTTEWVVSLTRQQ